MVTDQQGHEIYTDRDGRKFYVDLVTGKQVFVDNVSPPSAVSTNPFTGQPVRSPGSVDPFTGQTYGPVVATDPFTGQPVVGGTRIDRATGKPVSRDTATGRYSFNDDAGRLIFVTDDDAIVVPPDSEIMTYLGRNWDHVVAMFERGRRG